MRNSQIVNITFAIIVSASMGTARASSSIEGIGLYRACETLLENPLEKQALGTVMAIARTTTNAMIRSRAMTICTMAPILQDDPTEYRRRLISLSSAFPQNPVATQAQPRNLSEGCPVCDSSEKELKDCIVCYDGNCAACGGTGRVTMRHIGGPSTFSDCGMCKGRGRCSYCKGEGVIKIDCRNCDGHGQVLSKKKAESVFLQSVKEASDFCYNLLHPEIRLIDEALAKANAGDDVKSGIIVLQDIIKLYPLADNINSAKGMLIVLQEKQKAIQEAERVQQEVEREKVNRLLAEQRQLLKVARISENVNVAIDAIQEFIGKYPDSPYFNEAKTLLRELQDKKELVETTGL